MMELSKNLTDAWLSIYSVHMLELSLFAALVWLTDRILPLETRLRYVLWNLVLFKAWIPPVITMPFSFGEAWPHGVTMFAAVRTISVTDASGSAVSLSQILFLFWLISVLSLTAFIVYKSIALGLRLRRAKPIRLPTANGLSQHLRDSLQVFETAHVASPTLFGLWSPRIFLPRGWRAWSSKQLQTILIHEMAHIRSRDLWMVFLQYLALILFAVNPLVWFMHKRLNDIRELRCDEAALRETNISPVEYGKFILEFVPKPADKTQPMFIGRCFSAKHKAIRNRLNHILNFKEVNVKTHAVTSVLLFTFLGVLMIGFSWNCNDSMELPQSTTEQSALKPNMELQKFDEPPQPVDGFQAIAQNLKYPEIGRRAGIEGKVSLQVLIDEKGNVADARVLQSDLNGEGNAGFEESAIAAIKSVEWVPAKLEDNPVSAWVALPVQFKLSDKERAIQN